MNVDTHEPQEIKGLLMQATEVNEMNLNDAGFADYMWHMWDGTLEQVERKQIGELTSDLPHVEDQIRLHCQDQPDAFQWLIIEGIWTPHKNSQGKQGIMAWKEKKCYEYVGRQKKRTTHIVPGWFSPERYERIEGFITGLERVGVRVRRTFDYIATSKVLIQMERSAQTPSTTLSRHIKPHVTFHPDPQVMNVLGVGQGRENKSGVGEVLALRMVEQFGTLAVIINLAPDILASGVEGMGIPAAKQFLMACGRTDI